VRERREEADWQQHPQKPVVHHVGTKGQPKFQDGWHSYDGPPFGDPGFYKDSSGIVHLTGLACRIDATDCFGVIQSLTTPIFTLPPGRRDAGRRGRSGGRPRGRRGLALPRRALLRGEVTYG
jgi:hypothetical protein